MLSYTKLRNLYGQLTNNPSSASLTLGDSLINSAYRQICAVRPWYWLEGTNTAVTVADQQAYALPYDYDKLINTYQLVGAYKYIPREIVSQDDWDRLNQQAQYESNYPIYFHIYAGQLNFWPIPSTAGQTITYNYRKNVIDLSIADYTTGTVTTNGTTTVTGSGTSWNTSMIGKFFQITPTATAATNGDGFWYKVSGVASTTSLTLEKAYAGSNVTGAAYTIGQMPALPEAFQDTPVYKAAEVYFTTIEPEPVRAQMFRQMYDDKYQGLVDDSKKSVNPWVRTPVPGGIENPNLFYSVPT
jgi:hypothetical protein